MQAKVGADSKPGFFAIASPPDVNNSGGCGIKDPRGVSRTGAVCRLSLPLTTHTDCQQEMVFWCPGRLHRPHITHH